MAHHEEPMDIDCLESDFDNKENSYHHSSNVLPCTEKGYEELDVSELNMKLRYSITPAASPMSKSYTAYVDNKNFESDETLNFSNENANLTRSLNSTMTNNDIVIKSLKTYPLQTLSTEQILDNRGLVLRQLDSTTGGDGNVTVTISEANDINENVSLPSSSSSVAHTPEATTPTNLKNEEGSPIIRGLKSVFNMFRSSQSPIPPVENDISVKAEVQPLDETCCEDPRLQTLASTPISAYKSRDGSSKRSSPLKTSIVFNDDLEKELQWKEDTILFSEEKIPIHKLFLPQNQQTSLLVPETFQKDQKADNFDSMVEYMDISHNNSMLDNTATETRNNINAVESDGEFEDCETTFTKNESLSIIAKKEEIQKDPLSDSLKVDDLTKEIVIETETIINKNEEKVENDIKKKISDVQETLDVTKEIVASTMIDIINSNEKQNMASSSAVTLDVTRDIVDNVSAVNENKSNNEFVETKETVIQVVSDIYEKVKCIDIQNEPSVDTLNTLDVTVDILPANEPADCGIPEVAFTSVVESKSSTDASSPKSIEIPTQIPLIPKVDDVQSTINVDDKSLQENPTNASNIIENTNISNEVSQVLLSEVDRDNKQDINITQLIENENTAERVTEILNVSIDSKAVLTLGKEVNIKFSPNIIDQNGSTEQNVCVFEHAADNTNYVSQPSVLQNSIQIMQKAQLLNDGVAMSKDDSFSLLATEPENIPLPDNDDFDIDLKLNTNKLESLQAMPPDVLDTLKAKSKQDVTETLFLDNTNTTENSPAEHTELSATEKHDVLNETNDIVNSLTEMIGESQNTTIMPSINNNIMLDQSQTYQMENIEFTNELHTLPDIVNETIHNMSVDEKVPEVMNHSLLVSEMHCLPETVSENKTVCDTLNTSAVNITTEQSNDAVNANKEHTDMIVVPTEIIDAVPETNLDELKSNEAENALKEKKVLDVDVIQNANVIESSNFDEELVLSENNSPYVSVIVETESKATEESFENINISLGTRSEKELPPSSPPIRSKGYNFNFDEMDDPFATKTKIRQSPPSDILIKPSINQDGEDKITAGASKIASTNRRRSQPPERKRPVFNKKKMNTTFNAGMTANSSNIQSNDLNSEGDSKNIDVDIPEDTTITMDTNNDDDKEVAMILDSAQVLDKMVEENLVGCSENNLSNKSEEHIVPAANITVEISAENKSSIESMCTATSEMKTSSSEQSTYYSAAASSSDSSVSKNVFNLPEIDDKNFNPFATKSRMTRSPPLQIEHEDATNFATKSKIRSSPDSSVVDLRNIESAQLSTQNIVPKDADDKMNTEVMEKDSSYNICNITSSSKGTDDKNITIREVNTEDEDTEEGPFLEAEDAIDKLLDVDNDMMQFSEIPPQATDADSGELFIDAEAFEFLLNKNKSNVVTDSGKESLFLKFDPLFAKRISSDGVLSALNKIQKRQSTPTKPTRPLLKNEASPIAGPSTLNVTYDEETNVTEDSIEDLNVTVAKPMMVVTPAVNPAVTPRNKTTTPPRSNRRSITFTSPAMAVIDRLLSLSGNNSYLGQDNTVTQASREHIEADLALTQLRELLAEKEISVYQLRSESKELKDRLTTMETQVKILEADGQGRLNKINELTDRLAEKTKVNKSMAAVVEEYERTIASLIAETEQDKKRHAEEKISLINERDEQTAHLTSMEVSFNDLHSKYEKSKQVILSCKANEEACKKSIKDFEENLIKMQTNYEMLKQHATSKLNNANQELQKITKSHESEVLKLNAMIKRKEMHITSLEETLAQKTKANEELTAICDELINKVG